MWIALLLGILVFGLMVAEAMADFRVIRRKMTIEKVHQELREGMSREEIEVYFARKKIPFGCSTWGQVDRLRSPTWVWKSPDAVELCGGNLQNNGRT
jgi:hypothetical protein